MAFVSPGVPQSPEEIDPLRLWSEVDGTHALCNARNTVPSDLASYKVMRGIRMVGIVHAVPSANDDPIARDYYVSSGVDLSGQPVVIVTANMGHEDNGLDPLSVDLGSGDAGVGFVHEALRHYRMVACGDVSPRRLMAVHQERLKPLMDPEDLSVGGLLRLRELYGRLRYVPAGDPGRRVV